MKTFTLHLLPNAHLDPVWLWDWREGLTEGIITVSTILDLMDEVPELTFNRGESIIYRHIQTHAPEVFDRMMDYVQQGRWDVVGGTLVQPDSNLSCTETLCRQYETGLDYFQRELGVRPRIAWQADSFGHPAGWPNILRAFGMEGFMFTRPQRSEFPMKSPLFWWECDHNDQLLCYRQHYKWYCTERNNMKKILDTSLAGARECPYKNVGVLMGLGNHGGGPTRRNLQEVKDWAAQHPEVKVIYSTMHRLFDALQQEINGKAPPEVPSVRGEFGYCLRGCYSSVQKFKSVHRQAEAALPAAETTQAVIASQLPFPTTVPLEEAWDGVMFNSFHDILPGSSIERAVEDQLYLAGKVIHKSQEAQLAALTALARHVDTRVPPPPAPDKPRDVAMLVWNPAPTDFKGLIELEASLDYRPISEYLDRPDDLPLSVKDHRGHSLPFQRIPTEHTSMSRVPWRARAVVTLSIPALGWKIVRMGLDSKPSAKIPKSDCRTLSGKQPGVTNGTWSVSLTKDRGVSIRYQGKKFFSSLSGLELRVYEDIWGSWGGMKEEPASYRLDTLKEQWRITQAEILEEGPERCVLWTRWSGENSWCELRFLLSKSSPWITVKGRMLWNERSSRLQLILPSTGPATVDVPGSTVIRKERGQSPVGRWFIRSNGSGTSVGIASDTLSDVDFCSHESRITLARASRYACSNQRKGDEKPWLPAVDCGELTFNLGLFTEDVSPKEVVREWLTPPVALPVPPTKGPLAPLGSFGNLKPSTLVLLALQTTEHGIRVRVQNPSSRNITGIFTLGSTVTNLGKIAPGEITHVEVKTP